MTKIAEIFGVRSGDREYVPWATLIGNQLCPYLNRTCIKVRKSEPDIAIGTCSVYYGKDNEEMLICPNRFLDQGQVFIDCLHLLSLHEPGNELHVVPEISLPGGSVDYFLASVQGSRVKDFVGIELQTLDTTGTVWPERQRLLRDKGIHVEDQDALSPKNFGMNWKMTAKTILVQLHHKSESFEYLSKHLVLVIQDVMLRYLRRNFQFGHFNTARMGDPIHFHSYSVQPVGSSSIRLQLGERLSTDSAGIAVSLGLQADPNVELAAIVDQLESKISKTTLLSVG